MSHGVLALAASALFAGCGCPEGQTKDLNGECVADNVDTDTDVGGVAAIVADPCGGDFGLVKVDSLSSQTVKITNSGTGVLTITEMSIDSPFLATSTTPVQVAAGSSYQFTVRFNPTDFGSFSSDLVITSDDPDNPSITCTYTGVVTADADGDGYDSIDAGGDDCNDDNADVYPGAPEVWYDGKDSNCDGLSDFDQDGDGYESSVFNDDPKKGGGDCQDVDPNIHPGVTDTWYDGKDSDCDGSNDYDQDGDGYTAQAYGGTDCNDTDASANPDGSEAFDGVDNNCDGIVDNGALATEADVNITGNGTSDAAGHSVAVGDFDDDGKVDLVASVWHYGYAPSGVGTAGDSQGAIAIWMSQDWKDGDDTTSGDNLMVGAGTTDEFGYSVANVGDWNDDGIDDLGVAATAYTSKEGSVYLFSGPDVASGSVSDAWATFTGNDDYQLGAAMGTNTDLNGDGVDDLVMYGVNSWNVYNYLAVEYGGNSGGGAYAWTDMDSTWKLKCGESSSTSTAPYCGPPSTGSGQGGTESWAYFPSWGSDLDGDGYDDLVLGDKYDDSVAKQSGRVWILWGKSLQYSSSSGSIDSSATIIASGDSVQNFVGTGYGASPDADGDGDDELWIEDGAASTYYFFEGGSDLRNGGFTLSTDANASFTGVGDDPLGMANIGDWTGDGVADFGIAFDSSSGEVMMFPSQIWSGSQKIDAAIIGSIKGDTDNKNFGVGILPVGQDLNGDGSDDIAIGDYGYNSGQGSLHIFYQK